MGRYNRRRDDNHGDVRDALEAVGVLVIDLGSAGCGVPDLLVQHVITKKPIFIEVKNPLRPPSGRKVTKAGIKFSMICPVVVVKDIGEAMSACGVTAKTQEG